MKIRYNREIISGAIFVVLSAVLWFLIPVQVQTLEKTPINAQTFPRIAIGGMFLCSVGLLRRGSSSGEAGVVCDEREFSLQCL